MTLGPRQFVYRASCNRAEIRLRVNPGDQSWIVVKRPGRGQQYVEIADHNVDDVVARFHAIDGDPERFTAFVQTATPAAS